MANDSILSNISSRIDRNLGEGRVFFRPDLAVTTLDGEVKEKIKEILTGGVLMANIDKYDIDTFDKGIISVAYNPISNGSNAKLVITKIEAILRDCFTEAAT